MAIPHGYALIDKQLLIPEKWFTDEYSLRRKKSRLPEDIAFMSKPQLAAQMLKHMVQERPFPFRWVVADSIYGNSPEFMNTVENCPGLHYFVCVPSDTPCWLTMPITRKKAYKYKGQLSEKNVLERTEKKPIRPDALARSIHDFSWCRRTISEGTKGPIAYEFTKRCIVLSENGIPDKTVWLSGFRWPIEQCLEEAKEELGMDHYEVRK